MTWIDYMPSVLVITKVAIAVIAILYLFDVFRSSERGEPGERGEAWLVVVIMAVIWLFCDVLSDVLFRFGGLVELEASFVASAASLGAVYITIISLGITVAMCVRKKFVPMILFAIVMAPMMYLQVIQISDVSGVHYADALLSYAQQAAVIIWATWNDMMASRKD